MKTFNAKLLLFGEYGLMFGSEALAVPFSRFKGSFEFSKEETGKSSRLEIERFVSFFCHHELNRQMSYPLNLEALTQDLENGLYFDSDIPLQYGVGSSGALCAAIYDRYGKYQASFGGSQKGKNILFKLKKDFSVMETYFHGKSSGFDPLVSFINRPILLSSSKASLPIVSVQETNYTVCLIDTAVQSSTSPLVQLFTEKMKESAFEQLFNEVFLPANDLAIAAFLKSDSKSLFEQLRILSGFQLENMKEMIPEQFQAVWKKLLADGIFLKLLGSGGGGYLLAFVKDGTKLDADLISLKVF